MGGKVEQVNDNIVLLSNLTGAEYFDAFVDMKDISAVVIRVAGREHVLRFTTKAPLFFPNCVPAICVAPRL